VANPQVVSVPVGLPQQISQQLLQQQGAQLVSAAAGQNLAYNVMQPMQTVTVDGQEALFIPAMSLAGGQQPQQIFSPGQIIRAPGVLPTNLQTVQLSNGQSVAVRPTMPQVVQFPMQQTIPIQVPISSGNGQTIYQTIHFPVQLATTAMPNIIQAQHIMPQVASIITPNGQLQQVQIATSVAAPAQTPTSVSQSATVQSDVTTPLTFTGANGQQFTVIPATNLQQVRGTNIIQVPNIQTIPTVQNIPGTYGRSGSVVLSEREFRSRKCSSDNAAHGYVADRGGATHPAGPQRPQQVASYSECYHHSADRAPPNTWCSGDGYAAGNQQHHSGGRERSGWPTETKSEEGGVHLSKLPRGRKACRQKEATHLPYSRL
jgi:hypothetical protein